jgi:SAM-dependent methyltransferase
MRLSVIEASKAKLCSTLQPLCSDDISDRLVDTFHLAPKERVRRKLVRLVAPLALRAQQPRFRRRVAVRLPFSYDLLSVGERFGSDASVAELLRLTQHERIDSVLVPGCYLGSEDVQFWLRRGAKRLDGVDAYSLNKSWGPIVASLRTTFGAEIVFQQASVEQLPHSAGRFDLVVSTAVLEHVRNLTAMVNETARVLRAGGWAHHDFGPLYYCFGGDHCIAAFGFEHGYDHLLLDEPAYRERIDDQGFFDTQTDPNLPFWARHEQFSFATAQDYIRAFSARFRIMHLVVKVSDDALAYRRAFPDNWQRLLRAGVAETDLLVKSLGLVLRKR